MRKKILILNGQYAPGYKGGGPIQSCMNMVENLANQFDFYVLCADRDYRCDQPYSNIEINTWNRIGNAQVFYMSPDMQNLRGFKKILGETEFDLLYLNGFYSPIYTIIPLLLRRIGRLKKCKVILTPRGDFTGGTENKKVKKYSYIYLSRMIGLYSNLIWHATSELEGRDIKRKFPNAETFVIPNLPTKYVPKELYIKKSVGEIKLVFISRIFPKKNLKYALEILKGITNGKVIFDIYGPMEDATYWDECQKVIDELPPNIIVTYKGEIVHNEIPFVFQQYHAFLFPTLGENYGHVIVESMMNNCLVILSQGVTPWDDYNENGGFVEKLSNKAGFQEIINKVIRLDEQGFRELVELNKLYVTRKIDCQKDIEKYIDYFDMEYEGLG